MKMEALYRPLTIAMPIAAFLCATGVSAYQWKKLKQVEGEAAVTQGKLTQIDHDLRSFESQPQTQKFPTVPRTPREQAMFLDALRANADFTHVQLVRWSNSTPPAPPPATPDKPAPNPATVVTPIISTVEVAGRAENTRMFLYNVVRCRRLLNMSEIKWVRDTWPNTHLTFTLTRYVAPAVPLPTHLSPIPGAHGDSHDGPVLGPAVSAPAPGAAGTGQQPDRLSLPNPMDAPGLSRGYQSRLEAGVSQLNDMDRSQHSASPRPSAVPNAKR